MTVIASRIATAADALILLLMQRLSLYSANRTKLTEKQVCC